MVFIVDDSKALRARLVELLSEIEGVSIVGEARTAEEAIEGIRRLRPRVVILDIQMPGGSGLEVLKAVKGEADAPIVLMLTNHPYPQYRTKCFALGADYFLDKTRDFDKLTGIFSCLFKRFDAPVVETLPGNFGGDM